MDYKEDRKKVTAIVPAYNEGERIGAVLAVLTSYGFREVLVIDDGSTDDTATVSSRYDVRYLKNGGKGRAMDFGVKSANTDILFFCDADLRNMTHEVIDEIIAPVVDGKFDMFVGMNSRGIYALTWVMILVPLLGGQRAITKDLWEKLPEWYKNKFRIEAGLNFYSKYYGRGLHYKIFPNLSQVIKEKKYGFIDGTKKRFSMVFDVLHAAIRAEVVEAPRDVSRKRTLYAALAGNISSTVLGFIVLYAAYKGPLRFILDTFSKELIEDPNAFFIHFLIRNVTRISVSTLILVGAVTVVLNLLTTLVRLEKLRELSHVKVVARRRNHLRID